MITILYKKNENNSICKNVGYNNKERCISKSNTKYLVWPASFFTVHSFGHSIHDVSKRRRTSLTNKMCTL